MKNLHWPAAIFLAGVLAIPHAARSASWTGINSGLPAISVGVNSLTIDPLTPSTIYAQTSGSAGVLSLTVPGLFKTIDGGANWMAVGAPGGVTCFAIDPSKPSTLYAGTDLGVSKSLDGGQTWSDASQNLPQGPVTRLAIDPLTSTTLYAATTTSTGSPFFEGPVLNALYKTTDGGASWNILNTGLPASAFLSIVAVAPAAPSTIYVFSPVDTLIAGSATPAVGGLIRSVDGGQTWTTLKLGSAANIYVVSLAIDPVNTSTLYALMSNGILKSQDGGDSWSALNSDLPAGLSASVILVDRATQALYLAATSFGSPGPTAILFKSVDGGQHWSAFQVAFPTNTIITSLAIDPVTPSNIYAGSYGSPLVSGVPIMAAGGGVAKSSDGGKTWNDASHGLSTFDVRALALSPADGAIYAGGFAGASKSTDGGATWSATGLRSYTGSLVADSGSGLYALTGESNGCSSSDSALLTSTDGGATWNGSVSPLNSGCVLSATFPSAHASPMAIDPADANTLLLGESDDQEGYSAIVKSSDKGMNWSAPWDWFNGLRGDVLALAIAPTEPPAIFAGIDDGTASSGTVGLSNSSGLFKSTDGGATWSDTGLTRSAVNLLAVDPSKPQTIYAATEGHYSQPAGFQGLSKSVDGGATWTAISTGLSGLMGSRSITATALVIDSAGILYLGTSSRGVFQSADGGATWNPLNDGLGSLEIRGLAVSADASRSLYAATLAGMFKYSGQ